MEKSVKDKQEGKKQRKFKLSGAEAEFLHRELGKKSFEKKDQEVTGQT